MLNVGHKVVHPAYGAGVITDIGSKQIGAYSNNYYTIDIIDSTHDAQLMVPVRRADELGLRSVGKPKRLRAILETCQEPFQGEFERDYRKRKATETDQIKSGDFEIVAEMVRTLTYINSQRTLGTTEHDLLRNGKEMLAGELALSVGRDMEQAMEMVDEAMNKMLDAQTEEPAAD